MSGSNEVLPNSDLAELLAREAIHGRQPLQRALHRAARRAFLWPEEAAQLIREHRSLTELPGVGPYLSKPDSRLARSTRSHREAAPDAQELSLYC